MPSIIACDPDFTISNGHKTSRVDFGGPGILGMLLHTNSIGCVGNAAGNVSCGFSNICTVPQTTPATYLVWSLALFQVVEQLAVTIDI